MNLRHWLSALLAVVLLAGMLVFPAAAVGSSRFTDIPDPVQADAAEMLRLLGIVNGTGGSAFQPKATLTRGEFCKMTVELMGRGEEEPAQRSRTIFTDVGASHWARGYINLASSITIGGTTGENGTTGATRLMMGVGDGTFQPNRPVTVGEAVTILMRVLGYEDKDVAVGAIWYEGYLGLARQVGLDRNLTLDGAATLTRGDAAVLFYNLLFTKPKGGEEIYLSTHGGSITEATMLMRIESEGGTGSKVVTLAGTYESSRPGLDETLGGTQAKLVLDKDKKILAVLPETGYTYQSIAVMGTPQANAIPTMDGETVAVTLSTQIYRSDSTEPVTYESLWTSLRTGTAMVLCYDSARQLKYIYMPGSSTPGGETGRVMVAKNKPDGTSNPFGKITGGKAEHIYKNGIPADLKDMRQYDVGTYDPYSKTLLLSDLRLSGLYEDAYPNAAAPSTITVMGAKLKVLPSAVADLSTFRIGSKVTFLLTATGEVAGAVSPDVAKSNAVGVARITDGKASIALLDGILTLEGKTNYNETAAQAYQGRLVNVSSYKRGYLTLSRITEKQANATLNLEQEQLGTRRLSPGVRFFERVENSQLVEIQRKDIALSRIPAEQILYVGYDWANRVDKLILNNVTGDRYTYGRVFYSAAGSTPGEEDSYHNGQISITNGSGSGQSPCVVGTVEGARHYAMGGVVSSLEQLDGQNRLAGYMPLQSAKGIRRAHFDLDTMTLTTNEMVLPISRQVQCYNRTTEQWYSVSEDNYLDNLKLAIAFSDEITVYYDRAPEQGGKVRIVEVK